MMRMWSAAFLAAGLIVSTASAGTDVYVNEADFLAAVDLVYSEDFASVGFGEMANPSDFGPVNGFSYSITAVNGLFSGGGNVSTNTAFDPMIITFTGNVVNAVGGNFWLTDFDFLTEIGTLSVTLNDGTEEVLVNPQTTTFRGFISPLPITSITLSPIDNGVDPLAWATLDNFHVGFVVPEPTSLSLLALGGMVVAVRRRK